MKADAAKIDCPDDVAEISRHESVGGGAVWRADDGRLEPVRARLGHPFLKEARAADPVRIALEEHRAAAHRAHERLLNCLIEADQVKLGVLALREEDLVGAGDRNLVPGCLDQDRRFSHYGSRYSRSEMSSRC